MDKLPTQCTAHTNTHSHSHTMHNLEMLVNQCLWTTGDNWSTWRKSPEHKENMKSYSKASSICVRQIYYRTSLPKHYNLFEYYQSLLLSEVLFKTTCMLEKLLWYRYRKSIPPPVSQCFFNRYNSPLVGIKFNHTDAHMSVSELLQPAAETA